MDTQTSSILDGKVQTEMKSAAAAVARALQQGAWIDFDSDDEAKVVALIEATLNSGEFECPLCGCQTLVCTNCGAKKET